MLTISEIPTFERTVTAHVPVDGGYKKETFSATFRVIPTDEFNVFDLTTEQGARDFLVEAIMGLDDIADENNEILPYSDDLRDKLLGIPYVRGALAAEYMKSVGGAQEGN